MDQQEHLLARNVTREMLKLASLEEFNPEEVFEVESILAHKESDGKVFYLICWQGYSSEHDTWKPVENIFDEQCIRTYWQRRGNSPSLEGEDVEDNRGAGE